MINTIWIESYATLPDHPKTVASAQILKIDRDALVGKLMRLWHWALQRHRDGFIPASERDFVAEIMRWPKKPATLFEALCAVPYGHEKGFLYEVENGYLINDWQFYTRHYFQWLDKKEKDRQYHRNKNEESPESMPDTSMNTPTFAPNSQRNQTDIRSENLPKLGANSERNQREVHTEFGHYTNTVNTTTVNTDTDNPITHTPRGSGGDVAAAAAPTAPDGACECVCYGPDCPDDEGRSTQIGATDKPEKPDKRSKSQAESWPGFDEFWAIYPLKVAKPAARKAWSAT